MDIQNLSEILVAAFPGAMPELEIVGESGRIGGFLIWSGFDGMEQLTRQRSLSAALRERLQPAELLGITVILTMTPDEVAVMGT